MSAYHFCSVFVQRSVKLALGKILFPRRRIGDTSNHWDQQYSSTTGT